MRCSLKNCHNPSEGRFTDEQLDEIFNRSNDGTPQQKGILRTLAVHADAMRITINISYFPIQYGGSEQGKCVVGADAHYFYISGLALVEDDAVAVRSLEIP
jgi:hypothetical protein